MAVNVPGVICNMALDHIGKPSITSLEEDSLEAKLCRRQYDPARRFCLSRSMWTFARKHANLALRDDNDLSETWAYRYDLPNDTMHGFALVERGTPFLANRVREPAYVAHGSIYTHLPEAVLVYTYDSENTAEWSATFDDLVATELAARILPNLTRRPNDVQRLRAMNEQIFGWAVEQDAVLEPSTYTYYQGGYVDARGARTTISRRQADGSTIWD